MYLSSIIYVYHLLPCSIQGVGFVRFKLKYSFICATVGMVASRLDCMGIPYRLLESIGQIPVWHYVTWILCCTMENTSSLNGLLQTQELKFQVWQISARVVHTTITDNGSNSSYSS